MGDEPQGPLEDGYDAFFRPGSAPRRAAEPRRGFVPDDGGEDLPDGEHDAFNDDSQGRFESEPTVVNPIAAPTTRAGTPQRRHPFTISLGWTALSAVVPGLGLLPTRRRAWGLGLASAYVLGLLGLAIYVLRDPFEAAKIATRPTALLTLCVALVVLALLWSTVIVGTHLLTRPRRLTGTQRVAGAVAVAVLTFVVSTPLAVAARYSWDQARLVQNVFGQNDNRKSGTRPTINTNTSSDEVWKNKPRLNLLLVGTDQSSVRNYSATDVSTDTMMVASIDTQTGNMVLIQVPRNMANTPFPPDSELAKVYPNGFSSGRGDDAQYFANAIWGHVPAEHPDLFANTDYPGADALKLGMQGALGLKIDYFVALNIDGLVGLIDAMGGVKLNVNERIPVAGNSEGKRPTGYIEPGPDQHLSGYYAMWYARSRSASTDFSRMSRQSCVIKAVIDQADPQTMLTRYEAIAKAGSNAVSTDIPSDMLPHLVDLASRVKDGKLSRVLFVHGSNGYVTYDPDFEMMQRRVSQAIADLGATPPSMPLVTPTPTPSVTATPTPTPTPTVTRPGATPSSTGTPTPKPVEDLNDACAYNPVK
ncbi:LCP family protein [Propionibacteriaceae bacterium G1746]|uniref:LCP family glycopolymer transferase n=1 Tax=Aestuariimicrobium sp. G57 TaxID=3418485 RepID=UPI003C2437B8